MHKNLSGPKSRKAKNHFYYGSLCQRLVLSFRRKKFLICQLFLVKTDRQRLKTSRPKKPFAPSSPQSLMKSPINMNDNVLHFEKIFVLFFDLGEISRFDSFLTVKKPSKNCQNKISRLNQKTTLRFFQNVEHCHSYLLGISSKIGGKGWHLVFFGLKVFIL